LIKRRNPPSGWALPGGFVDYGETLEAAALREAREETGLDIENMRQFHAYSDPSRDLRRHTISMVFVGFSCGKLLAGDDAAAAAEFDSASLPEEIAFDHRSILDDYFTGKYR